MHRGWCLVPRARDPPPGVSCCFHGTSSSCLIAYVEAAIDQLFMTCSCILNGASVLKMSIITCPITPPSRRITAQTLQGDRAPGGRVGLEDRRSRCPCRSPGHS